MNLLKLSIGMWFVVGFFYIAPSIGEMLDSWADKRPVAKWAKPGVFIVKFTVGVMGLCCLGLLLYPFYYIVKGF